MTTRLLPVLAVTVTILVSPALGDAAEPRTGGECPAAINVAALCNEVNDMLQPPGLPDGLRYGYQYRIRTSACVVSADPPQVVQSKIRDFWKRRQSSLTCNLLGFSVRNGSILKLALERDNMAFLDDAVRRWKVDLNYVDAADNRTVLDYAQDELVRTKGTSIEPLMKRHVEWLRRFGAKSSRES